MKLNQRIKLIRTTEGFTQVEFAKLIGVSGDRSLREIESGKRKKNRLGQNRENMHTISRIRPLAHHRAGTTTVSN
jgi:DNA-binding XRE family transcriptional regulator